MAYPVFGEKTREKAQRLTSSPLQVTTSRRIGLTPSEAFRYVTDATKLQEWLPMPCKSQPDDSKAERPGGVGSVRVIRTGPMPPTLERVVAYEPEDFYAYSANDASLMGLFTDHLSAIGFESHPKGGTVVTWLAFGKPARSWLGRYLGLRVFQQVLDGGLDRLERKFPPP